MKRKTIAISIAVAAVLGVMPTLAACSGDHFSDVRFDAQDTSYRVESQGGNAVSYGNYIYFINGTRGYDDAEGTANVWNETVKGALYRAELNGSKRDGEPASFVSEFDAEGLEFKYTAGTDYFDKPVNVVNVTAIAPKTIGTASYKSGGIFIYDNFVYFASPNNSKNAAGTIQTTRTDFFMMPLSGGAPTRIYTTAEGVDTSSSAYAFYKFADAVYLVVNEGGKIVSVRVNTDKAKADDPVEFDVGATSVYFPVRGEYYTGIDNNTAEDFIYFVRNVKEDSDEPKSGTVIEAMRPDGSENFVISMARNTETIEAVRDGVLFYRTKNSSGKTVIAYDSLHDALMKKSETYAAHQNSLPDGQKNEQFSGRFPTEISDSITSTYAFRADTLSNEVYFIGVTANELSMYKTDGSVTRLAAATGTPKFIENNYLYYMGSSSDYHRVPLWLNMDGFGTAQDIASEAKDATLDCDYVNGYFTYFAKVDEWADGYAYFYKVDGRAGIDPQFVGQRADFDIPTEEQLEEKKKGESSENSETEE